jgi:cutinase
MKFFAVSFLAATLITALPVEFDSNVAEVGIRQTIYDTRNDLVLGSSSNCPQAIFIFARASTETGNIVRIPRQLLTYIFLLQHLTIFVFE